MSAFNSNNKASNMQVHNIMTVTIPDLRPTHSGVSSPRSSSSPECSGYSCAFPSWPNRPCLSSKASPPSLQIPDIKFVERLRGRTLPEESIIDDEDVEDSEFCPSSYSTILSTSTITTSTTTSTAAIMKRSNSLLSRALHKATNVCVASPAIELHTS